MFNPAIFGNPHRKVAGVVGFRIKKNLTIFEENMFGMRHLCVVACAVAFTVASCAGNGGGLKKLDKVIAGQKYYRDSLESSMNVVRREFEQASSDSARWVYARRLFSGYYHYSQDSSSRYQRFMEKYASDESQRFLARLQKVRILLLRNEEDIAASVFVGLDTSAVNGTELLNDYLQCEAVLCSEMLSSGIPDEEKSIYAERLRSARMRSLEIDSTSFYARRMKAQLCRDSGDSLSAVNILKGLYYSCDNPHEKASVAYNLARIMELQGDENARFDWLVRSAVYDFKNAERAYMSLYELALVLYDRRQYRKAEQYISQNLMDVIAGNFSKRLGDSGKANLIITDTVQRVTRSRTRWLVMGICMVTALLFIILILLRREVRHKEQMEETNKRLVDANKIRNGYVFRYMALSVHYIDKIGQTRNEIRTIAKSEGLEAVMKALRSPSVMYSEYENYYRIFDETFLGIYPDFVEKVNALLSEDARFDLGEEKTLPTELRILAAIRIGITESGKIARFLKCSPNTVYTYRTKLKRSAACPKEDFEAEISKI